MADPNWNNGFYYDRLPPHAGMKLARREYFASGFEKANANPSFRNCHNYVPLRP